MKIMVVDDSAAMQRIIANVLSEAGYKNVVFAKDGEEALKMILPEGVDFVLLDWQMPKMNGLEFLKAKQSMEDLKEVQVIMVTSVSDKNSILEAVKAGVADYVTKPFTPEIIKEKIEALESKPPVV